MSHQEETISKLMKEAKDGNVDLSPSTLNHFELLLNMCYAASAKESLANSRSKPVLKIDKYGTELAEYRSAAEAARKLGIASHYIRKAANPNHVLIHAGGYKWRYK